MLSEHHTDIYCLFIRYSMTKNGNTMNIIYCIAPTLVKNYLQMVFKTKKPNWTLINRCHRYVLGF